MDLVEDDGRIHGELQERHSNQLLSFSSDMDNDGTKGEAVVKKCLTRYQAADEIQMEGEIFA